MNKSTLRRLEQAALDRGALTAGGPAAPDAPLTDAEEAERFGETLWLGVVADARHPVEVRDLARHSDPAIRELRAAARQEYDGGKREWAEVADRLRPYAVAAWAARTPGIRRECERRGEWVWTERPAILDISEDEFAARPLGEQVSLLREPGLGYWQKAVS